MLSTPTTPAQTSSSQHATGGWLGAGGASGCGGAGLLTGACWRRAMLCTAQLSIP